MPFGVTVLLARSCWRLQLRSNPSDLSTMIADNIYVDNVVIGIQDSQNATSVHQQAKELFAKASSMNLREWTSNSANVRATLPKLDQVQSRHVKVLGINWDTHADQITIPRSGTWQSTMTFPTKRTVSTFELSSWPWS